MPRVYLDRIERRTALILDADGADFEIPAAWLPAGAREGQWLRVDVDQQGDTRLLRLAVDADATAAGEAAARERLTRLRRADAGGELLP